MLKSGPLGWPKPPAILSYGLAVLSIIAAVIILWLMEAGWHAAAHVSLFLFAIIFSTWFGGVRPCLLAIALSILAFDYFFLPPIYSLAVDAAQLPRFVIFVLLACFVGWLTAVGRGAAEHLRQARDELQRNNEELRRQIVQRQRAEDRTRFIIDTIPTMVWSLQADGTLEFVNQRWMDYTGLSLEEVTKDSTRPMHPEDTPRVMEKWLPDLAAGRPSEDEMRLRRADGEYRWFLVRTAPLRDESGKIIKWYGVSTDIDARKRAEGQLTATTEQLRALSASLRSAREQESTRIAREIHDELGGALTTLRWDLEEIADIVSDAKDSAQLGALRKRIDAMVTLTEATLDTVRRLASELRPIALDELGLVEAIEWHARQFESRTGIVVQYECALDKVELNNEQSIAVFRILQEALTNILRHAQANRVAITMRQGDGEYLLTINDNGRGIREGEKSGAHSLGLLGMRERAHLIGAKIDITGLEGKGTLVAVSIPISLPD
jgi:two-component system sensor histidine kinase UhpB